MFSTYDGLGYPDEHFTWCMENGLDAHAITEHGNMNSYPHAVLWVEDWNKKHPEKPFLYIPGVEMYFHPDLEKWKHDKEIADADRAIANAEKKSKVKAKRPDDEEDDEEELEMKNALTIENESESKSNKRFNPVNRRHHLVLLPKTQGGLLKIFSAVSSGYLDGFYRFPRIDARVLRDVTSTGEVIVSSACVSGLLAYNVFQEFKDVEFDALDQSMLDDPAVLDRCVNAVGAGYDLIAGCMKDRNDFYLELQFNRLGAQNLVNRSIIEFVRRRGITEQLTVTCDAHYYRPELWRDREIYKRLGFMNYETFSPDSLPKSRDELKCELYPKNAAQIWEEYERSKEGTSFYDDEEVCAAVERTYDIAHNVIGNIEPDRSPKFAVERLVPKGVNSFNHLVGLCKEGMIEHGFDKKQEYVDRLKVELGVIKVMKNADYFISYKKIIDLARRVTTVGCGRGSGGGSLVNYVLGITELDPLVWNLEFFRFLSTYRCLSPETRVLMSDLTTSALRDVKVGDRVIARDGSKREVINVVSSKRRGAYRIKVNGSTFTCSANHEWLVVGPDGLPMKKRASDLTVDDVLYTYHYDHC
jgi:DNA polymerase III alpha subunit